MRIKTRKEQLSNAIKTVLPFTGKLNEFKDIKFLINGNILKLVAQSENASNIYKLNVEADEDFEFSVDGSEINNIVDTFKSEITITKENETLIISEGKTKLKLMCNINPLPIQQLNSENTLETKYQDIKNGLIKTVDFTDKKQQVGVITGVLFAIEQNKIKFAGTDGNFLSFCEYEKEFLQELNNKFILPVNIVKELIKIDSEFVKITWTNSKIKFDFEYMEITTNLINGAYPQVEAFLNVPLKDTLEISKEELSSALKKAQLLTTKDKFVLNFEIEKEEIKISFENSTKSLNDYISCKFTGDRKFIKLNCELLPIVIKNCSDIINIRFSEQNKQAIYFENGNNRMILMMCS